MENKRNQLAKSPSSEQFASLTDKDVFGEFISRMNAMVDIKEQLIEMQKENHSLKSTIFALSKEIEDNRKQLKQTNKQLKNFQSETEKMQEKTFGVFQEQANKLFIYKHLETSGKYFNLTEIGHEYSPRISPQRVKKLMQYAGVLQKKSYEIPYILCESGDEPMVIRVKVYTDKSNKEIFNYLYHKEKVMDKIFNQLKKDKKYSAFVNATTKQELDAVIDGLWNKANNISVTDKKSCSSGIFGKGE